MGGKEGAFMRYREKTVALLNMGYKEEDLANNVAGSTQKMGTFWKCYEFKMVRFGFGYSAWI